MAMKVETLDKRWRAIQRERCIHVDLVAHFFGMSKTPDLGFVCGTFSDKVAPAQ